ncbi:MAG: hypothetical protein NXI12_11975 [Alphaproteobacteria bacterium]|nr:hypothetical protein [Alphaproteobacteria bacterium]
MINLDPTSARRPGLPVPTRRDARVTASAEAGGAGVDDQHPDRKAAQRPTLRVVHANEDAPKEASVASAASRVGVFLQADMPNPRRGLRADAGERARYRAAYECAARQPAPRPSLVRSA